MTVFTIAHPREQTELFIEDQSAAGADGLTLRIEAPGAVFALSPTEVDLVSDWLYGWAIERDRRAAIRIEH